ncbi:hypothetical protein COCNU_14G004050 [Cocos nucifera]|uniref:Uncharacterized protein n=1 Tax=Cocos nucifera TaxID=13894 RepID=A0A8K0IUJ0_COCNU|nr:hypothetical protein COCNU_14G004050 [Cocos nucifera]
MDPKASAKSKRSHSQQGRKNHQLPATRSAQKKKDATATTGSGGQVKPRGAHGGARDLPSNWDRYDDDDGDNGGGDGAESSAGTKPADGEIRPKSKGADFSYLIEQARSRPQEHRDLGTSQSASSSDELCFRNYLLTSLSIYLFISSLMDILWHMKEINLVPFLSMDLHALAAQLSKLKLSQRLFIEEDLLPEEPRIDKSKAYQISKQSEAPIVSTPARFLHDAGLEKFADAQTDHCDSCNVHGIVQEAVVDECQSQTSTERAGMLDPTSDSIPPELSGSREVQGSMSHLSIHTYSDLKQNRISRFEAAAVEEELDMLLNSFGETSLSSSHTDGIISNASTSRNATFNSSAHMSPPSVGQDPSSSGSAGTALADAIDDLLAEATLPLNDQNHATSNVSFQSLLGSNTPGSSKQRIDKSKAYQISKQSEAPIVSTPARFLHDAGLEKFADAQTDHCDSCNVHGIVQEAVVDECQSQTSTERAGMLDPTSDSIPPELSGSREVQGSMSHLSIHTYSDLKQNRISRFEAAAVEEELDMLLNSFGETSLSSSHTDGIISNASTSRNATFNSSAHMSPPSVGQDPSSSGSAGTALADAIDDLLAEATLPLNDQNHATSNVSFQSLLGSNTPGSSKQVGRAASLDNAIDDLLAETSFCLEEEKNTECQEKQGTTSSMNFPSHSPLGSKPVNDFDSWFDTL